jgi:hypothetical protein
MRLLSTVLNPTTSFVPVPKSRGLRFNMGDFNVSSIENYFAEVIYPIGLNKIVRIAQLWATGNNDYL